MATIDQNCQLFCGDCLEVMKQFDDESVDMVVTSPPYDNLRKYNGYSFEFEGIAQQLFRVVKKGGIVVWVVGDQTINGSESGTSFKQALYFKEIGFNLYDTMIWLKPSPACPTESRYYDVFEYMFIFSKEKPKTLNLLADRKNKSAGATARKETRSCREDRKYKDGIRTVKEYSRRFNVWEIARGRNPTTHPAVFPEQLASDHVRSWSNPGDIVLDPFMGSGTTGVACRNLGRNFIGIELDEEYFKIAENRIKGAKNENI